MENKYVPIVFGNDTEVLFDCKDEPIVYHSKKFKKLLAENKAKYMFASDKASDLRNILIHEYQKPSAITIDMPVGDAT